MTCSNAAPWLLDPTIGFHYESAHCTFFACQPDDKKDGVVFTATFNRIEGNPTNEEIFDESGNFAYYPPHITSRIIGQSGCFIFCGNPTALPEGDELKKLTMPEKWKYPARDELAVLGIRNATLFPGIEGICKDINIRIAEDLFADWI